LSGAGSLVYEKRIDETLDLVGLTDKADRAIKGFSGGERQRLEIAVVSALVAWPSAFPPYGVPFGLTIAALGVWMLRSSAQSASKNC
jgi:ABC-type taurine transport system ATPase subunit